MEKKNKYLNARQYLNQLQEIDLCITQELERLDQIQVDRLNITGIDYSKDRIQTSPGNALQDAVTNYVVLSEKIKKRIDQFVEAKEQIISEIRGLHIIQYNQVLYKRYVEFKDFKTISDELDRSYSYVIELHKKALSVFEKTYKNLTYLTYNQ